MVNMFIKTCIFNNQMNNYVYANVLNNQNVFAVFKNIIAC